MNKELMEALDILEREKEISKDTLFEAIENSLITAYRNRQGNLRLLLLRGKRGGGGSGRSRHADFAGGGEGD